MPPAAPQSCDAGHTEERFACQPFNASARGPGGVLADGLLPMVQRCLHPRDRQRRALHRAARQRATLTVTAITITPSTSTGSNRSTAVTAPPLSVGECLSKRARIIDQDCARRFSPAR